MLFQQFELDFRSGTSDIDNFKTMDDLEKMLTQLVEDTQDIFTRFYEHLVSEAEAKGSIRKKDGPETTQD